MAIPNSWDEWRKAFQARFGSGLDRLEDPELLLEQAQAEWREMHSKCRARAVKALTQRNQLQQIVADTERKISLLDTEIVQFVARGDNSAADKLLGEKQALEQTLHLTKIQLASAEETAEQVKAAISRQEELLRQKTANAITLQAQWKLVKIEQAISGSLAQINSGVVGYRLSPDQIRERHLRNREYVAEAITQKNELQQMVDGIEVQVANLRDNADTARRRGDSPAECELLRRMEQHEATLAQARGTLHHAAAVTDQARNLVQEESARVRGLGSDRDAPFSPEFEPLPTILPRPAQKSTDEHDELPMLLFMIGSALVACALFFWMIYSGV